MPRRKRSAADSASIGSPSSRMVPVSVRRSPEIDFTNVDFPAPLAPNNVTISPRSSARSTLCKTRLCPYPTETDLSSRSGMVLASQIRLDHAAVLLNLARRSRGYDGARIHHDDMIGHIHHQRHIVLDDQNRNSEGSDRAK